MRRAVGWWMVGICALSSACTGGSDEMLGPDPSMVATGAGSGGAGGDASSSQSSSDASSGSGSGGSQAAGFVSGSRLRAKFIQGGDGSKQFIGFYDSDKNVDCSFRTLLPSGESRCVPTVTVSRFSDITSNAARYSDPNCTTLAPPAHASTCVPSTAAYLTEMLTCGATRTWAVLGMVPGYYRSNFTAPCEYSQGNVWQVTEVPLSEWVLGSEMTD